MTEHVPSVFTLSTPTERLVWLVKFERTIAPHSLCDTRPYNIDLLPGLGTGSPIGATATPPETQEVPEPASMLLLGSGLLGGAAGFRRRFGKGRSPGHRSAVMAQ